MVLRCVGGTTMTANKGIGFEIASLLAGKGLNIVITARNGKYARVLSPTPLY
jgi:short-subunit dehydrogenase